MTKKIANSQTFIEMLKHYEMQILKVFSAFYVGDLFRVT